jgi:hypothetical protein
MKIVFRSGGIANPPQKQEGIDSFVIELDNGTPVVAGFEVEGALVVAKGGDPGFENLLKTLKYQGKPAVVNVVDYGKM